MILGYVSQSPQELLFETTSASIPITSGFLLNKSILAQRQIFAFNSNPF